MYGNIWVWKCSHNNIPRQCVTGKVRTWRSVIIWQSATWSICYSLLNFTLAFMNKSLFVEWINLNFVRRIYSFVIWTFQIGHFLVFTMFWNFYYFHDMLRMLQYAKSSSFCLILYQYWYYKVNRRIYNSHRLIKPVENPRFLKVRHAWKYVTL